MSIDRLGNFIDNLCRVIESNPTEDQVLAMTRHLMSDLVSTDDWLPEQYALAHPDHYQQYLLFCDSLKRFSDVHDIKRILK
jgi:predicted metal-dependent enzyme (double-stranded beta helix superfamily)